MTDLPPKTAVILIAHGTVESLDDLPRFLTNIRRGHAPPPELIDEVRRRYLAIGGKSPLLDITYDCAKKLEAKLGLPVRVAMRLFEPYPKEVITKLVQEEGIRRIVTVPLAQHSASIYGMAVKAAAKEIDPSIEVLAADNWGREALLTHAFSDTVLEALAKVPQGEADRTALVLTAHSLPLGIIKAGDPYEKEFRGSAEDVAREVKERGGAFSEHVIAFQSQGIGTGIEWLGPDLRATFEALAARGKKHVVVAPIGFLADHVEILYDLDIEARAWAGELGIVLYRSSSLNANSGFIDTLAKVAEGVIASSSSSTGRT